MNFLLHIRSNVHSRREGGQAAIEFAVIMPFVFLMAFFLFEGVQLMSAWTQIQHATREGARVGSVRRSEGDIIAAVTSRSNGWLTAGDIEVAGEAPGGTPGDPVTVSAERDYTPNMLNAIASIFGASMPSVTIRAQTQMRLEE